MNTETRRPCPECGSAATIPEKYDNDLPLSVCTHCQLTFSPATPDWPDDLKLVNFNAHPLSRDVVGSMRYQDPEEFTPERMIWAFGVIDPMIRAHSAGTWMEYARNAPDYAGGTVFNTRDVAYALHAPNASDPSDVSDEEVALVTEDERQTAIRVLEEWVFSAGTDWPDLLREDAGYKECDWCYKRAVDACDFHTDLDDQYLCADCAKKCCITCSLSLADGEHDCADQTTLYDRDALTDGPPPTHFIALTLFERSALECADCGELADWKGNDPEQTAYCTACASGYDESITTPPGGEVTG